MARYPHLVDVAWDIVEKLVADWKVNPHYWESEIDIQAELRSRLSLAYSLLGRGEVIGVRDSSSKAGAEVRYRFSRVSCEPSIRFKGKDGQTNLVKPDVVVWGDPDDPRKHMGDDDDSWPILWACEIKYLDPAPTVWDLEKLEYLIDEHRIDYGCWLTFNVDRKSLKAESVWDKHSRGTNLWMCKVRAPEYC